MSYKEEKARRVSFMEAELPMIEQKYEVKRFVAFVKITIGNEKVDYYPGVQRLYRCSKRTWHDMTIKELVERLRL